LTQLNEDFFKALGENKTLENLILDMDKDDYINSCHNNYHLLALGVAMNKKKNGSLKYLSLRNVF
jgi:hypothetical protein